MPSPEELELVQGKISELKNSILDGGIFTHDDFLKLVVDMRARMGSGDHPTNPGVKIGGDVDHYKMAVDEIERELAPLFTESERIYGLWVSQVEADGLPAKAASIGKYLSENVGHEDHDKLSFIASNVASRYDAFSLEKEENKKDRILFSKFDSDNYSDYLKIDMSFITRTEKILMPDQLKAYETYLSSLQNLEGVLDGLFVGDERVNSPTAVRADKKEDLDEAYNFIIESKKSLKAILRKIPGDDSTELEKQHNRLKNEAEALLGVEIDESKSVFTEDMSLWLFDNHGEQWRKTQRLWEQHMVSDALTLLTYDKATIESLAKYFSAEIDSLDEKDAEYHHQFIALSVQLNRLQDMKLAIEEAETTAPSAKNSNFPEHELPSWFEMPEIDSATAWQKAYAEAAKEHGPNLLRSQAKYLINLSEGREIQNESFKETFDEKKQYEGLEHAMAHYRGEDEEEIHELAVFLKMRETLFEAQAGPNHSWSMTCDMDQLPPMESLGVSNGLFDYFTLGEDEAKEGEKKYKHSHHVKKLVQRLIEIFYEDEDEDFKGRNNGGLAFKEDGVTPQKGYFGYYHWKDTGEKPTDNKPQLLKRMQYELELIAPALSDEDIEEVVFFAHRVSSMCGIRQDGFTPYMASGATPVDMLGDLSRYIGEVNLFAPELYSTYKKRIYLQLSEIMSIDEVWWEKLKKHKKASPKRMDAVRRSLTASRLVCETMSDLREPYIIPIADDGISIKNTYYSMYDLFFNDEVREKRRDKDVTLKAWQRGKEEFVEFKKICFDTPGKIDVNNIGNIGEDELVEMLVGHVDTLINRGMSYMKKNYDMAQWREMAIMTRWGIDRCFRVFALKNNTLRGSKKLLKEIRARIDQANTIVGAGKKYPGEIEKIGRISETNAGNPLEGINLDFDGTLLSPISPLSAAEISALVRLNEDPGNFDDDGDPHFNESTTNKLREGNNLLSLSRGQSNLLKEAGVQLAPLSVTPDVVKKLEDSGTLLSYFSKEKGVIKVVDAKDFLSDSYPNWTIVDFSKIQEGGGVGLSKPERDWLTMGIIHPKVSEVMSWAVHPLKRATLAVKTNRLLSNSEYELFKQTAATGAFGIKAEKQQQDPDAKK